MKLALSLVLSFALVASAFGQQTTTNAPPREGLALAAFVVTVAIIGLVIVVKVSRNVPGPGASVTLELQKSADHSNWLPVETRQVTLAQGQLELTSYFPQSSFSDQSAFYRAVIKRP